MFTIPIDFYGNLLTKPTWITQPGLLGAFNESDAVSIQLQVKKGKPGDTLTFSQTGGLLPTGLTLSSSGLISGTAGTPSSLSASQIYNITVNVVDQGGQSPADETFQIKIGKKVVIVASSATNAVFQTYTGDPATTPPTIYSQLFANASAMVAFQGNFYVACNNNLFISAGDGNWRFFVTISGVTSINSLATDGTTLVAAGANSSVGWRAYSTDAFNWTATTGSGVTAYVRVYYFSGTQSLWLSLHAGALEMSTDGINWSAIGPTTTKTLNDVGYDPASGKMVLVANDTATGVYASSTLGTWTLISVAGGYAVAWISSLNLWLKTGFASQQTAYSSNMTVWTISSITGTFNRIFPVNFGGLAALFGGNIGGNAVNMTPTADGIHVGSISSIAAAVGTGLYNILSVTDVALDTANNRFFTCGHPSSSLMICRYTFGTNWTPAFELVWIATVNGVMCRPYWTGHEWIIPQAGLYSLDGISWRYINSTILVFLEQVQASPIAGFVGARLLASTPYTYTAYTSTDLINWTQTFSSSPSFTITSAFTDFAYSPDGTLGVVIGTTGWFALSSGGNFTGSGNLTNTWNFARVLYTNGTFVVATTIGRTDTNPTPASTGWLAHLTGSTAPLKALAANGTNIVASGTDRILSLDGGATWSRQAATINATDICYSATLGKFIEVGATVGTVTTTAGVVTTIANTVTSVCAR